MFYPYELECIQSLQSFRTPTLDTFFRYIDFFDRAEFFFVLIPIIWLGYSWKAGFRFFYIFFINALTNHLLKEFFSHPRPFHIDPSFGIVHMSGYGFPSGAAQTVIILSGLMISTWKSSWKWVIAFLYISLVSFSRMYLGAHFPGDILAGWVVGGALLACVFYIFPLIERGLETISFSKLCLLSQLIPLGLLVCLYSITLIRLCSTAMAMGLGLCISYRYHLFPPLPQSRSTRVVRASIGIIGTFLSYTLTRIIPHTPTPSYVFFQFYLVGLWISLGANLLIQALPGKSDKLQ